MSKIPLKLYNTLTNKVEEFKPIEESTVKMYTCGPTVYSYAHIGNFRAYVFMDVLRRVLKFNGLNVKTVMNITDVGHLTDDEDSGEDKMELAAKKEHKTPMQVAEYYTKAFFEDAKKLNIDFSDIQVEKATDNIDEMIEFIKGIIKNGYAYEVDGNVYFDVAKYNKDFDNKYGELSGLDLNEQLAGARIEVNKDKTSPYDFALWIKAPKEHIMKWESPWSIGYPGWHIECSAMGVKYLGEHFDIHTGGVDHIPVHHENEIAQTRGLTCDHEHTQANYWMHCEFLKVDNGKMSKSLGNVYTIAELEKRGFNALDFRYFLLNANFRKSQNFTWEALEGAKQSRLALVECITAYKTQNYKVENDIVADRYIKKIDELIIKFTDCINYDLNIAGALGVVWEVCSAIADYDVKYEAILEFDKILGLDLKNEVEKLEKQLKESQVIPENIKELADLRWQAKQNKEFKKSDDLRDEIKALGYTIKDGKDSYEITKD
jgi:cysteinyl-tRNA synthetase